MKLTILPLTFFLFANLCLSQSTFEYLYSSPLQEISRSIIEDSEGNIFFTVENHNNALIIKLDHDGNFLDSLSIVNSTGTCTLSNLIEANNEHLIAIGDWSSDTSSELWFMKFDYELNEIENKKLSSNNYFIFEFHHLINNNGNIVFIAHYLKPPTNETDICIFEITMEGELIRSMFYNTSSSYNHGYSLLENTDANNYRIFAKSELTSRLFCFINVIDTNFDHLYTHFLPPSFVETPFSAKSVNDSIYLLSGKIYLISDEDWNIGIHRVNNYDSILSSNYFGKTDTVDWTGLYNSFDFISPNNIFFAGTTNSFWYPFQNDPSWIMLNILDSALNLKSQHFNGGDAYYLVNAVLATEDSGCVMACSRYDWLTQDNEFDVYILKVNKDGLLVSIPENNINQVNSCSVYPNPASTRLTIHFQEGKSTNYSNRIIEFLNASGIKVKVVKIPSISKVSISVQDLEIGVYLLNIRENGKVISSKKLIISR
jgi:hypothetical protein